MCGGTLAESKLPGLLACNACSFTTADLTVSDAELERLYGPDTSPARNTWTMSRSGPDPTALQARLSRLLPYVADPGSKRLFEIGSAYGFFLEVARQHFRSVEGIDISTAAAFTPGSSWASRSQRASSCPSDVRAGRRRLPLGHNRAPSRSTLVRREGGGVSPPGGVIAVTTGDIGSLMARWRGARWRQIHPPTHLHYFSKLTLAKLLERHGFTIAYAGYDGMYRSVDTMA